MSNADRSFTGEESVPDALAFDTARLMAYLDGKVDHGGKIEVTKFRGGQSNPTFALTLGTGRRLVLRRKPPGKLLPSAHAIDREFRVTKAVDAVGIPVARPILYCDDPTLVGSEFYLTEFVSGRVFWDPGMLAIAPTERAAIYRDAVRQLARIHSQDITQLGLDHFGKGEGYTSRNLQRWSDQYRKAETVPIPDMHWLINALAERVPRTNPVALMHGDYGLYNVIVRPDRPEVMAILDWELSTLGDPLVDLAHHIRPWWLIPEADGSAPTLVGRDLKALGLPDMDTHVDHYFAETGKARPADWGFYLAFVRFRYAAMIQGVLKRKHDGTGSNRVVPYTEARVAAVAAEARRFLSATE